jgi:hypothetical protein
MGSGGKPAMHIYGDSVVEADWFRSLTPLLGEATMVRMKNRGANAAHIADLLAYDRPDIILVADGKPVLVVEKTREVPTGHNVGQRMARLIRAVEAGVPTIKFFPFEAMKHGTYAGRCFLNARLLEAFAAATRIHDVPLLAVNWPVDAQCELLDDGHENDEIAALVHEYVASAFDTDCAGFVRKLQSMEAEHRERIQRDPRYRRPPASARILRTEEMLAQAGNLADEETKAHLMEREETLLYSMAMTPEKCRREDPYTGTQFIYDYIWCRSGPDPSEKHRNLVLSFPKLTRAQFTAANPNDSRRKACNWYLTATAMRFSDGFLLLHP